MPLETVAAEMVVGGVSGVLFSVVADNSLLDSYYGGLRAIREFEPGEAAGEFRSQMRVLQDLIHRGLLPQGRDPEDIHAAHRAGTTACMFSVEGGDFIEDRLERVGEAHALGVRVVTLIHYHTNQIGDTQTEAPRHGGLTPLGRDIIRTMNREGVIVDLAHASYQTTVDAVQLSSSPMLISHTNLRGVGADHPRLISLEHARLVTSGGGVIGAVPAGFDQNDFGDYLETILRMVDALGVDHVGIGTDMDFTYRPVFTSYRDWAWIPAGLIARGMRTDEVAKIMGGNFLRVLQAVAVTGS